MSDFSPRVSRSGPSPGREKQPQAVVVDTVDRVDSRRPRAVRERSAEGAGGGRRGYSTRWG